MIRKFLLSLSVGAVASLHAQDATLVATNLWNVPQLLTPAPALAVGATDGLTQEVWYEGEPLAGKPTRIFAYLGKPAGDTQAPRPAVLLVHGGGGRAYKEWAMHWAARGYIALAMDTAGQGPDGKRHADAGPDQGDNVKFQEFTDAQAREQWSYHAVAAVLRGHGLLNSLPGVDRERVAITGISWGGYLTCLVAGLDPKLKAAVPVYGCGFLGDNSYWRDRSLAGLTAESRQRWLKLFDPSQVIKSAACPMFFLNGTHDFAYPPDSYRKTFSLVPREKVTLSVRVDLDHGHIWTFNEVDAFIDNALQPGPERLPLVRLGAIQQEKQTASVAILPGTMPVSAQLHVTKDTGSWTARQWQSLPVTLTGAEITADLPQEGPLTFFFTATDIRGLVTSSAYLEMGTSENTACIPHDKLEDDSYGWYQRHDAILALHKTLSPEVVMIGDSITHFWAGEPDAPSGNKGTEAWKELFKDRPILNLGFGWDRTQNVLWRFDHGELQGLRPKSIVIHIGTNNLAGTANARENTPAEIAEGIQAVVERAKAQCPGAKIILMAVFPRGETADNPMRIKVAAINAFLPAIAKNSNITLLEIGDQFCGPDGRISQEIMGDFLHPTGKGYAMWANALKPVINP